MHAGQQGERVETRDVTCSWTWGLFHIQGPEHCQEQMQQPAWVVCSTSRRSYVHVSTQAHAPTGGATGAHASHVLRQAHSPPIHNPALHPVRLFLGKAMTPLGRVQPWTMHTRRPGRRSLHRAPCYSKHLRRCLHVAPLTAGSWTKGCVHMREDR